MRNPGKDLKNLKLELFLKKMLRSSKVKLVLYQIIVSIFVKQCYFTSGHHLLNPNFTAAFFNGNDTASYWSILTDDGT